MTPSAKQSLVDMAPKYILEQVLYKAECRSCVCESVCVCVTYLSFYLSIYPSISNLSKKVYLVPRERAPNQPDWAWPGPGASFYLFIYLSIYLVSWEWATNQPDWAWPGPGACCYDIRGEGWTTQEVRKYKFNLKGTVQMFKRDKTL